MTAVPRFVLLAALLAAGCQREATDATAASRRYTGTAPWTVAGIRPGMTLDEVKRQRGEPAQAFGDPPRQFRWNRASSAGEFTATVDASGRVVAVHGDTLNAGDRVLAGASQDAEAVLQVLGKGEEKAIAHSGSYVIATPGKQSGTEYHYRNGDARFRVIVMKDRGLTGVVAELDAARPGK